MNAILKPMGDVRQPAGNLSRDESFATTWTLVVEENTVACVEPVRFR